MQIKALERAGSLLTAFLEWWSGELAALLPKNNLLQSLPQQARVRISIDSDGLHIPELNEDAQTRGRFSQLFKGRRAATVSIADRLVLSKTIHLPRALLAQAEKAIRFQVEQHMPLDLDKVYAGYQVSDAAAGSDMVSVEVAAVRRSKVDALFDQIDAAGFAPDVVSTGSGAINLRIDRYASERQRRRNTAAILTVFAIALFMAIPIVREMRITSVSADLQQQLTGLLTRTKQATEIRRTLDGRIAQLSFLAERENADIFGRIFNTVSDLTPNDIWLTEIQYDGKTLRLTGTGRQLAEWSLKLQEQEIFQEVRLENVAGEQTGSGLERFQLSATVKQTAAKGAK